MHLVAQNVQTPPNVFSWALMLVQIWLIAYEVRPENALHLLYIESTPQNHRCILSNMPHQHSWFDDFLKP